MLGSLQAPVVQPVDAHSNKSVLISPPLMELERLAERSRLLQSETAPVESSTGAMRSLRRRLAPQVIAALVARYTAGETAAALSREFGMSKCGLLQLLRSEGVLMRKQPMTPQDAKQAARLYERSLSITEIVEQIGYSYSTVRKSLHESGTAMRPKGIKRSALNKD